MRHQVDNVSWSTKVGLYCITRGHGASIRLPWASNNITLSWWGPKPRHMLQSLNMVYFHFTLSLKTHRLQYWVFFFLFPIVWSLGDIQGPLDFHGHGSWFVCKEALRSTIMWILWREEQLFVFVFVFTKEVCGHLATVVLFFVKYKEEYMARIHSIRFGYLSTIIL